MVKAAFNNVKISGISAVVPSYECSLLDDENLYDGNKKRIERVIKSSGFLKRRVSPKDIMTSDLCLAAANDLLEHLKIDKNTIDGLIFLSYTPDYIMPATSYILHKKLGLSTNCIVMDIPQACSGYVLGLFQSSMLINSGCKKVLVLVGDSFSKFSDMFKDNTAPVFGDAGSATLVEFCPDAPQSFFNINSDGNGYDKLICENGGFRNSPQKTDFYESGEYKYNAKMDGGKIFDFTMANIAPSIEELSEFAGEDIRSFDYYLFHQANKFILENIAAKLNIDSKKMPVETLSEFGNQCGASIPCTIAHKLRSSVQNESSRCLLAGFGVGLSWACAIMSIDKIYCSEMLNYEESL